MSNEQLPPEDRLCHLKQLAEAVPDKVETLQDVKSLNQLQNACYPSTILALVQSAEALLRFDERHTCCPICGDKGLRHASHCFVGQARKGLENL